MKNNGSTLAAISDEQKSSPAKRSVGLLIADPADRRLIEGIVINLDLAPTFLEDADLKADRLVQFEMVIADERIIRDLRPLIKVQQNISEEIGVPGLKCASGEERHWTRRAYGTGQEIPG